MLRLIAPGFLLVWLTGCAVNSPGIFNSFGGSGASEPPPAAAAERQAQPGASAGILGNLWDKVSSGFEPSKAKDREAEAAAPSFDPQAAETAINAYRSKKGLKPLKLHPQLAQAAKAHSEDLAKNDRISHYGSDGSDPWDRVRRAGYRARLAAENVGAGQTSLTEVIKGWKESPDHNANLLLRDAQHLGIAMIHRPQSEFRIFWTLVVGAQ